MKTLLSIACVAVVALFSSCAFATPSPPWKTEILGEFVSQDGEDKIAFLKRVGRVAWDYTKTRRVEVCAVVGVKQTEQGEVFGIRLKTDGVKAGCAMGSVDDRMEGFAWTGETFHTHPRDKHIFLRGKDKAWAEHHSNQRLNADFLVNEPNGFSVDDFRTPGYLVANGRLLFQNGTKDSVEHFGSIND